MLAFIISTLTQCTGYHIKPTTWWWQTFSLTDNSCTANTDRTLFVSSYILICVWHLTTCCCLLWFRNEMPDAKLFYEGGSTNINDQFWIQAPSWAELISMWLRKVWSLRPWLHRKRNRREFPMAIHLTRGLRYDVVCMWASVCVFIYGL